MDIYALHAAAGCVLIIVFVAMALEIGSLRRVRDSLLDNEAALCSKLAAVRMAMLRG